MKFQLVIQFRPTESVNFDQWVAIEDALIDVLGNFASVDGHDMGSGEFNIFVRTDSPIAAFQRAQLLLQRMKPEGSMNVAYRSVNDGDYIMLWPPHLPEFSIA